MCARTWDTALQGDKSWHAIAHASLCGKNKHQKRTFHYKWVHNVDKDNTFLLNLINDFEEISKKRSVLDIIYSQQPDLNDFDLPVSSVVLMWPPICLGALYNEMLLQVIS